MSKEDRSIKGSLFIGMILLAGVIVLVNFFKGNHVILNEVCCYNDTVAYDTIGNFYDYIELYNPTESAKDISGFYLSDDKDNLQKYQFAENTVIESKQYLLRWGGEWTSNVLIEGPDAYLGFSLREEEEIYLSDASGRVIDKVKIPAGIARDTAYSRITVADEVWKNTIPSPGQENTKESPVKKEYLQAEVQFNVEPGFYEEPFYLEMQTNDAYDIYYTLDGSMPTKESTKYVEPLYVEDVSNQKNKYANITNISLMEDIYFPNYNVEKATVVRAVAVDKKGVTSKDSCATYFVGYGEKTGFRDIMTISLITDPKNLFSDDRGIYVTGSMWEANEEAAKAASEYWYYNAPKNYGASGKGWRRETQMQVFGKSGELLHTQRIAIGMHGLTSLAKNQKSFNLFALPESDGNQYVYEGFLGKKETSLMLRNSGSDIYATKLRDGVNQEMMTDRAVAISGYEPCQVFLDGEYWGVYMLQERVSASTISNQYSVDEENVILLKGSAVTAGEESDIMLWNDMVAFATENDLSIPENYAKMEEMIDIQSCIDQYCFQVYTANYDSISNNIAMWRTREVSDKPYEDGKWRWMLYDTDASSGVNEGALEAEIDSFKEGNYGRHVTEDPLFVALIANEEFKQRFVTSFLDIANYNFEPGKVKSRYDEWAAVLCDAMVQSQKRFLDANYSSQDYMSEIYKVNTFFERRFYYISYYLKEDFALKGELVPVRINNSEGGKVLFNTIDLEEKEYFSGKYYSDYDISLSAYAKDGYKFTGWEINGELYTDSTLTLTLEQEVMIKPIWEKTN